MPVYLPSEKTVSVAVSQESPPTPTPTPTPSPAPTPAPTPMLSIPWWFPVVVGGVVAGLVLTYLLAGKLGGK
jgi:hypothetical protein